MTVVMNILDNNLEYFRNLTIENSFGKSLKQIKLKDVDNVGKIIQDMNKIYKYFKIPDTKELEWRLKSIESMLLKLNKYQRIENTSSNYYRLNSCLNDIIGFRIKSIDDKNEVLYELEKQTAFRVVNLLQGKQVDDGYRAIHLYLETGSLNYPIEIQIWFEEDYDYNYWMHKYAYKILEDKQLKELFKNYKNGKINSEKDFFQYIDSIKNKEIKPSLFEWS